jgi:electron transfer flavoprotein alpha subunit
MAGLLVFAEMQAGRPSGLTLELLALARRLAGAGAGTAAASEVTAAVFAARHANGAADLIAHGADQVFSIGDPDLAETDSERCCASLVSMGQELQCELILLGHTPSGSDLAPRLAVRLDGAMASGCTDITRHDGALLFTRVCHGGNALESLRLRVSPAVATVRNGVCDSAPADAARHGRTIERASSGIARGRVVARRRDVVEEVLLQDARVVVAGGRGVNGSAGFRALQRLATMLGGALGASRVACDLGWCPHSWQIGLTGKSVAPALYLAAGISGASHHMAGCVGAGTIVAINSDAQAPIFRRARFGIVGDCAEVIPAISAALAASAQDAQPHP